MVLVSDSYNDVFLGNVTFAVDVNYANARLREVD